MKRPTQEIRDTIIKALDYLADAEPSDDPAEERQDDQRLGAAEAWIKGHALLPNL